MAEWSVNLLSDDKALLQFANYDQSLAEKIVNALKELLDRFLGYLKNTFGAKTAAYLEVSGMRDTFNSMWLQVSEAAKESTAGSISVIRYAAKDEESVHIKQAILDHLDELNTMEPVADISVPTDLSTKSKSTQYSIIEKYLKKYGKFIDRNNFGKIEINKDLISSSLGYLKTDEEYASIIASPLVLKRGIIIEDRVKRAGRDYYTLIIGAPVILNGTRGNIGIALKITKGYRFKMLRILTPNGTLFIFNKKTEDAFSDISLDKGQGRPGTSANNNVSQSSDNIKKKLSLADKETVILPNMKIDVKRVFSKDAAVREQYKREREKYEKDFDDAINKIIDSDNFAIMQVGVEGGNTQYIVAPSTREDGQWQISTVWTNSGKEGAAGVYPVGHSTVTKATVSKELRSHIGRNDVMTAEVYRTNDKTQGMKFSAADFGYNPTTRKIGVNEIGEYAMSHRPTAASHAYDLSENDYVPADIYEHPEWYSDISDPAIRESVNVLRKIYNDPEADVTIYRAAPKNEFNLGDWVTFSKKYAERDLAAYPEGRAVYSKIVKAKDVRFAGDDLNEFGYYPQKAMFDNTAKRLSTADAVRYSIPEDSEGNALTQDQIKYFEESKARDKQGRLKVVYHGTDRGGFTEFKTTRGENLEPVFFTSDVEMAQSYATGRNKGHLNMAVIDTPEKAIKYIEDNGYYAQIRAGGNTYDTFNDYHKDYPAQEYPDGPEDLSINLGMSRFNNGYITHSIKGIVPSLQAILDNSKGAPDKKGNYSGYYEGYINIRNPYRADMKGQKSFTAKDIVLKAYEDGYDGVIFENFDDYNYVIEQRPGTV
ncbi:MAG: hypothetical protein LKJ83_10595 [Eubacteriaceae bacterium]|jgi:hypothetical protein|nr:hypothetical protein [Eubacteriaceae bacterium]